MTRYAAINPPNDFRLSYDHSDGRWLKNSITSATLVASATMLLVASGMSLVLRHSTDTVGALLLFAAFITVIEAGLSASIAGVILRRGVREECRQVAVSPHGHRFRVGDRRR